MKEGILKKKNQRAQSKLKRRSHIKWYRLYVCTLNEWIVRFDRWNRYDRWDLSSNKIYRENSILLREGMMAEIWLIGYSIIFRSGNFSFFNIFQFWLLFRIYIYNLFRISRNHYCGIKENNETKTNRNEFFNCVFLTASSSTRNVSWIAKMAKFKEMKGERTFVCTSNGSIFLLFDQYKSPTALSGLMGLW